MLRLLRLTMYAGLAFVVVSVIVILGGPAGLKPAFNFKFVTYFHSDNSSNTANITNHRQADVEPFVPYSYADEVDLRIIIIVYNRAESLNKCLHHLDNMETEGDNIAVEIFLDKSQPKKRVYNHLLIHRLRYDYGQPDYHENTVKIAKAFKWPHGPVSVHLQKEHVGVYGQWIDSWRPRRGTNELAIIIEDDLDLSPYFWKWLKAAYKKYKNNPEVMGFSLRGNIIVAGKNNGGWLNTNPAHNAFMYKLIGSHGFAPLPHVWRDFQNWYHQKSRKETTKPYVPNIAPTIWYRYYERRRQQDNMWSMWAIYYAWISKKYIVYPNISKLMKKKEGELIAHREEKGLHSAHAASNTGKVLLKSWSDRFVRFPDHITKYDWTGKATDGY